MARRGRKFKEKEHQEHVHSLILARRKPKHLRLNGNGRGENICKKNNQNMSTNLFSRPADRACGRVGQGLSTAPVTGSAGPVCRRSASLPQALSTGPGQPGHRPCGQALCDPATPVAGSDGSGTGLCRFVGGSLCKSAAALRHEALTPLQILRSLSRVCFQLHNVNPAAVSAGISSSSIPRVDGLVQRRGPCRELAASACWPDSDNQQISKEFPINRWVRVIWCEKPFDIRCPDSIGIFADDSLWAQGLCEVPSVCRFEMGF